MTNAGAAGLPAGQAGAEAAIAATVQAVKASGAIVRVLPDMFTSLVSKSKEPLVVTAMGGVFRKGYQYLTSYKGLFFYTKSPTPLQFSGNVELIPAKTIWVPG
jgi:hypothetical protein